VSWRNPAFYLGPADPFGRSDDDKPPPRSTKTTIVERIVVREHVPAEVLENLESRMIDIAVRSIIQSKMQEENE